MSPEPAVRVAIVGCGQIGSRWDMPGRGRGSAVTAPSLSHAAAFSRHPGARLVAFCDRDIVRAEEAAACWGVPAAHADPRAMLDAVAADLVVIATTSEVRASVVEAALAAGVRTLVIEKPLATTLTESQRLVQLIESAPARALVNYLRHWDSAVELLRERRRLGALGSLQRLVGSYGKGLANNGSHLIDLAAWLCDARPVRARALGSPLRAQEAAWSGGKDPAIDAQVCLRDAQGNGVQLDMIATDASAFSCFELRMIGSSAIAELALGGRRIEWSPIEDDPDFGGYRVPGVRQAIPAGLLQAMDRMADEAVQLARGRRVVASCSPRDALATAMTVQAIRESASAGGAWVDIEQGEWA